MNFTVQNFDIIISHIKDSADSIKEKLKLLSELCSSSSSIYSSESSDMKQKYKDIANYISDTKENFGESMSNIVEELTFYKIKTLENEEETSKEVDDTNHLFDEEFTKLLEIYENEK